MALAYGISMTGQPENIFTVEKPVGAGKGPVFLVPEKLLGWDGETHNDYKYKTEDVITFITDVYVRFVNYRRLSKLATESEVAYYKEYYASDKCLGGCQGNNSQCRRGLCQCNEKQIFGRCVGLGDLDSEDVLKYRKPSCYPYCLPQECYETVELNFKEVTRVKASMESDPKCQEDTSYDSYSPQEEAGSCLCRQDMVWNTGTLECEVHIPLICPESLTHGNPDIEKVLSGRDAFGFSKTF